MRKKLGKLKFKRSKVKKVRDLVPEKLAEQAANLKPMALGTMEDQPLSDKNVPNITNETVAHHREEVLSGARKYIYPLQHSKHRIVMLTVTIAIVSIVSFLIYCTVALYRLYQHNAFLYRVTQVVPFPIARTGGSFISYEDYLFELRHYVHYYQVQLQRNFASPDDKQQLVRFRRQALQDVINNAYVKILADQNKVKVSAKEVDERIRMVRDQNRLGSNNKVFADVLRDYWGWSIADFKRSLKEQILTEKVVAKLDTDTNQRAASAMSQIRLGADFGELAKQVSEDPAAKQNAGDYGFLIDKSNPNVPPEVVDALFKLKPGQASEPINTGATLEIVKVVEKKGSSLSAKHISFNLKDISVYINDLKAKQPAKTYVKF